jgi:SAM-dependent methyltransferase
MSKRKPWHEDERFWRKAERVLFSRAKMESAPIEVDRIISLAGIKPGVRVLDLCCGVGRHVLELARRGFDVTGVDTTKSYIKKATQTAKKEGLKVKLINADMRDFVHPGGFDVILNLFTSFGYFEDAEDDRKVAANIYRSLKRGGRLIMQTASKEVTALGFQEKYWIEDEGCFVLEEQRVENNWSWIERHWIIFEGNRRHDLYPSHRLYSATELMDLLENCGFGSVNAYGDLKGNPFDHQARRLVIMAQK